MPFGSSKEKEMDSSICLGTHRRSRAETVALAGPWIV
ncbi:hypothetical protein QE375_003229 [Microbacterium foliorum]|jgi:hypothetical protein|uniref:Uncharacterized protein n=1 Tax=Microbacterium foliorum TaxID=104336 RepID=A0ABU1HUE6_9MICO|nr:hypothetical protein [Microbacterium foliorum]